VSAQNRVRLYWTNIPNIEQPEDKGVTIKDILNEGITYGAARVVGRRLLKGKRADSRKDIKPTQRVELNENSKKTGCLSTVKKDNVLVFLGGLPEGVRFDDGKYYSRNFREGARVYSTNGKSASLTAKTKGGKGGFSGLYGEDSGGTTYYRNLSVVECERLQTVPDNYTEGVSNTQRYKMLGNGWTVDVIAHIFKNIPLHSTN